MNQRSTQEEIKSGLRATLSAPVCYTLFGRLIGLGQKYKMYIDRFIKPFTGMRMLDIGCGTAAILNYLPLDVAYTGYDLNPDYIRYARNKHGHRAKFFNKRVMDISLPETERFDIVLADGLIHHLDNTEAAALFDIGRRCLKQTAFMLTIDPTFVEDQKKIDRFLTRMDRGRHVRTPEKYKQIAGAYFPKVDVYVVKDIGLFSLTGCILKCKKE